jgi:CO/xanthine dehydrogenase FAD-binding subunit
MRSFQYLAPIPKFEYVAPRTLSELFETLDGHGKELAVIAGGTDLTVALKERTYSPEIVVDLRNLGDELGGIRVAERVLRIGALATFYQMESSPLVGRYASALRQAAANVGTLQIRTIATLGGNLATASPAADSAPPLIALDAKVNLLSKSGRRTLPVQDFFIGVKKNALLPGEVIESVEMAADDGVSSAWTRGAVRNENVLSTVSAAVATTVGDAGFGTSRVALGAVAPTPILAKGASRAMTGSEATEGQADRVAKLAVEDSRPISDVRASAQYRRHLVRVLTRRLILQLLSEAGPP